jgi:predicted SAM-dependent methyltransferase
VINDNSIDLVVSVLVFGHFNLEGINQALKEITKILKDDEIFILAVPHSFMYIYKPKSNWISLTIGFKLF